MRIRLVLIALAGLVVSACAGAADEAAPQPQDPAAETTASPGGGEASASGSVLPEVEVIEVTSEERVDVASLVPNDKPLLLWFWAPH